MSNTALPVVQTGTETAEIQAADRLRRALGATETWLAAERHQLVLFVPVLLGAGIAAWFLSSGPLQWGAVIAIALAVATAGMALGGLVRRCLVFGGLLVAAGLGLAWLRAEVVEAPVLSHRTALTVTGTVLSVEDLAARGRTRILIGESPELPGMKLRISVRGKVADGIEPGAQVRVRAALSPPPGPSVPGGYHFARRAWFDGIGAVGYAIAETELIAPPPARLSILAAFERFRERLTRRLQTAIGGPEGGLAAALVTGDRGGVPEATTEAMRDSGLAHLISISGLHIAVVVGGVLFVTRRLLALSEWLALRVDIKAIAAVAAALAGVAYTLIAGASVPTVRSCIAVLIALAGLAAGREAITLRLVAVGAFLILIFRPEYLLSPSFQLSFAAVTAIVALYQSELGHRLTRKRRAGGWVERLGIGAAALVLTGIVAELALAPIALFHFNRMGLYGAAANLVAIPLTSFVILPLLIVSLVLDPFGLAGPFLYLTGKSIAVLIALAEATAAAPGAVARLPTMPEWAFGAVLLGGIWLCLWHGRRKWLGLVPIAVGALGAAAASPPDLIVDGEGRHLALVTDERIALLRPRTGDYIRSMWEDAAGVPESADIDALAGARCSADSCTALVRRGNRSWVVLATRSRTFIDRKRLEPACRAADIVVSDRRLPYWCDPAWLKLDRRTLAKTGAVSIWLGAGRIRTVAADDGRHPWRQAQ